MAIFTKTPWLVFVSALAVGACSSPFPEAGFVDPPSDDGRFEDVWEAVGDAMVPGQSGYPCWDDSECASGICVPAQKGGVCSTLCQEGLCPEGFVCRVSADDPSQAYCVVPFVVLCMPCMDDLDCLSGPAPFGDTCVSFGAAQGSFCGTVCETDNQCPPGYECNLDSGSGLCLPVDATCECSAHAVASMAATQCYRDNGFGMCQGERRCLANGLTACTAKTPEAEECDGEDNNCDGSVDEGLTGAECATSNIWGTCFGVLTCVGGSGVCGAKEAREEQCDLMDNDCDGLVDEGIPDTDFDGLLDCLDDDDDDDGLLDAEDNCPLIPNPDQADFEEDGQGDLCDPDDDNDGALDPKDNCRLVSNPDQADTDSDGTGDICDPDLDGDSIPNAEDNCAFSPNSDQLDTDDDTQGDVCDEDDDNDGVEDSQDNCPLIGNALQEDLDGDGVGDFCTTDDDGDGALDGEDNCPLVFNPNQEDTDSDSQGDLCDDDRDDDGVLNAQDNCPLIPNPDQLDGDLDGVGDMCDGDLDADGVPDAVDNCPEASNANQADNDLDLLGNACDPDDDNDGDLDASDCAAFDAAINHLAPEVCNGVDDNCSGQVDEAGAQGCVTYYQDLDGDLAGGAASCLCAMEAPYSLLTGGDCDDSRGDVRPGAVEACNGRDDDCNGVVDGLDALGCAPYFKDADGDGFGVGPALCLCGPQDQHTATKDNDCDDAHVAAHPGLPEICDGLDNDCNGTPDPPGTTGCANYYKDADSDGYGTGSPQCLCAPATPFTSLVATDCYDANPLAKPGQAEPFDVDRGDGSFDYNCDGTATPLYPSNGGCSCENWQCGCKHYPGWNDGVPACGQQGAFVASCDRSCIIVCVYCERELVPMKQKCK